MKDEELRRITRGLPSGTYETFKVWGIPFVREVTPPRPHPDKPEQTRSSCTHKVYTVTFGCGLDGDAPQAYASERDRAEAIVEYADNCRLYGDNQEAYDEMRGQFDDESDPRDEYEAIETFWNERDLWGSTDNRWDTSETELVFYPRHAVEVNL